jgi:hypothetical protein
VAQPKKYKTDKEFYVSRFLFNAAYRARQGKIPFNLTFEYLMSITTNECPILKTPFKWKQLKSGKGNAPNDSPALDKIIPELGYVQGNVAFISRRANKMKDNGTMQEHYAIADWIWSHTHAKQKSTTPVPTGSDQQGEVYPEHGTIPTTGPGEDNHHPDNHIGAVQGQDADHSTQASSGDGVGRRGEKMATLETLNREQDNWYLHSTYGWIER